MSNFRIYNQSLCPALWDEYQHLDAEVRVNLLRMAYDFYEKTDFKAPILDVYLMGSIANYNWTPESDADVHVVIGFDQLQMPPETAKSAAKTAGAQWNMEHEASVKGYKVELNIQDAKEEKPYVTGIYSLVRDTWVRKPSIQPVQVDKVAIQSKYSGMKRYIESAINTGDREMMKSVKKYLDAFRQYGLDTGGELSVENIVFKILRAKGIIKKLKDSITFAYDKAMTVNEMGDGFSDNPGIEKFWWLSPDCKFTRVGRFEHAHWAFQFLKNLGTDAKILSKNENLYNEMYRLGWIRVATYYWNDIMGIGYNHAKHKDPTNAQLRAIRDMGIECGATVLRDDTFEQEKQIDEIVSEAKEFYPPDARFGIGAIGSNDDVQFKEHSRDTFENQAHGRHGNPTGRRRFRYFNGEVEWSDCARPDAEQIQLVNNYLEHRGFPVTKHTSIYDDFLRDGGISEAINEAVAAAMRQDYTGTTYDGQVQEVTQKDMNSTYPNQDVVHKDSDRLPMMTLDNLKSMRDKAARLLKYATSQNHAEHIRWATAQMERYDKEIKRRLAYINRPINESIHGRFDPGSMSHDIDRVKETNQSEFHMGQKHQTWRLVPAKDLILLWATFAKFGRVDEDKILQIFHTLSELVIKICINTDIWYGEDPMFFYHEDSEEITDEENERFARFISDLSKSSMVRNSGEHGGNARYSDGSGALFDLLQKCYNSETPEELLVAMDAILNFVHGIGHMAKWFVEGGTGTLDKIRDLQVKGIHLAGRLSESPMMSLQGKKAMANDKPLRDLEVDDVRGNIVFMRNDTGGFLAAGYTLLYFMDSDEAAQALKDGKIPYLMFPRGTFHSGGSPITDIWKKKYQRPGTEHILGALEGNTDGEIIYVDMISVRPGWQRNHIAKLMLDALKKQYPNAKLTSSSQTEKGEKLAKGYGGVEVAKEGYGAGDPSTDPIATGRWRVKFGGQKTPMMTEDDVPTTNVPKLTLIPTKSPHVLRIMLGDIWFANTFPNLMGDGKWVLNRHDGAFDANVPAWSKGYETPQDLVQDIQQWLDHNHPNGIPKRISEGVNDVFAMSKLMHDRKAYEYYSGRVLAKANGANVHRIHGLLSTVSFGSSNVIHFLNQGKTERATRIADSVNETIAIIKQLTGVSP